MALSFFIYEIFLYLHHYIIFRYFKIIMMFHFKFSIAIVYCAKISYVATQGLEG